jgi:XTP/dITP diphosphohydrolase/tetrapyrrole methylase family protein/MazG family protein/ATP diphosphatase
VAPDPAAGRPEPASERVGEALLELDAITRRLRRDCPWDREQDERSIVPHTVEEAYELADAAHAGDAAKLRDELGDVLFQVYFLSLLLEERGEGDLGAVARGSVEKLVRRHPHVFGDEAAGLSGLPTEARTPTEVRENWDAIKRTEQGGGEHFSGIPENLPGLSYARKVLRRATGGADRVDRWQALSNLVRQVGEAEHAIAQAGSDPDSEERGEHGSEQFYEYIGELLLAAVELSRAVKVDPEIAVRQASERFKKAHAASTQGELE